MDIDEAGGILSMRYNRGLVMTACLDALDFYAPVSTNEVVTFKAGLNHVGSSSLEIGVKVLAEAPMTGEVRHACTAYLTFVHLGPDMRPQPLPAVRAGDAGRAAALARSPGAARAPAGAGEADQNYDEQGEVRALCPDIHGGRRSSARREDRRPAGKLFSKILREITVAARNGGGDPKGNLRLKAAVGVRQGRQYARGQHQARGAEGNGRAAG